MPPKRRGRPAATEATQPEPVADHERHGHGDSDGDAASNREAEDSDPDISQGEAESASFKFFNTTFSTFRVSPLYIGQNSLTPEGLQKLSRRLRDTLVGDVVRGVQVGLESDTTLGRLGVLERVEWRECDSVLLFPTLADTGSIHDEATQGRKYMQPRRNKGKTKDTGAQSEQVPQLLCLDLQYENAAFNAIMIPSLDDGRKLSGNKIHDDIRDENEAGLSQPPSWTQNITMSKSKSQDKRRETTEDEYKDSSFAHFPLLLMRMPAPLKAVLVDFLSSTFDCRISPLHLGTRTLVRSWERWIEESSASTGKMLDKDIALTLGFHLEPMTDTAIAGSEAQQKAHDHSKPTALGLKTIDIVVPSEEIRRFLRVGKKTITDPSNGKDQTGSKKRPATSSAQEQEKERLRRRRLGGSKDEEGWAWRESPREQDQETIADNDDGIPETFSQPFTDALSHYLDHHLALDMTHPGVRVLRVVCDAFALSDTRVKVFAPRGGRGDDNNTHGDLAIDTFLRSLVRKAQGREWSQSALQLANLQVIM
ncbi:kinetochore complex Sim4 subunit Fta1-domain-containing protein [Xylaria bambusicola]|uniref:kinetochore complex Sim4 subunit Fta1-domain-containing protein n=1 Tax=Xylaria bambusicola TaxID=326684 RepID=UPI0020081EB0|nr:kinetochore complex Sim4 subunit Fta1-domain-containing protein [Xylaria bambusicola]KAI0508869.1 kinetochore complex Sim4 subunit Fta1-domain-containing protein [Xylaria bambusicola]